MQTILHYLSYWDSALAVILVFGGLIFFHELGHFIAFKVFKVGIISFSIGMGPKIFGFKKGKTEYKISLFPVGGYVSGVGEYSDDIEELGFTEADSVQNRPAWQRIIIAFAGPFMNLVIALLIYAGLIFSMGNPIPIPEVGGIMKDSPAEQAGVRAGDLIKSINGTQIILWKQVPETVQASGGKELTVVLEREGKSLEVRFAPMNSTRKNIFGEEETAWLMGVMSSGKVRYEEAGFFSSLRLGTVRTWDMIDLTLTGLKKLITGSVSADNVGGPILIAQMLGSQAKARFTPLMLLAALISVNLGLLNLLPVPVLDGGAIFFCFIEMIVRRPIPKTVQEWCFKIGAGLLIALMVFATFNDILRWFK